MLTPKYDSTILEEWKNIEDQYISQGYSRTKAHEKIASSYDVSRVTVYYWLTPGEKEKKVKRSLDWEEKKKYFLNNPKAYRVKQKREKNYRRLTRHLDLFLKEAISSNERLTVNEIGKNLEEITDIRLRNETIKKLLKIYKDEKKIQPVIEYPDGTYSLNPDYYSSIKKHRLPIIEK